MNENEWETPREKEGIAELMTEHSKIRIALKDLEKELGMEEIKEDKKNLLKNKF
jgi:hemerythrin-like domain-containing protein